MNQNRFNSKLVAGILVALIFGVALYFRVIFPYDKVFTADWVKFTGVDVYYFMCLVDNLVHNFPHLNTFDPYLLYPGGFTINTPPFFPLFLSGVIWLIGLGSPTQHMVDIVGVYFPAVLGALTTIPVYFIGKTLFNRWAGVMAAGLVAIFPGEFLGRSILGYADYHVAEVLFTTVTMLFLILAVKAGRDNEMTFDRMWHGQWAYAMKPLIYSLIAGIFLGIYFLTWSGALLFVFIIFVYLVIQFIIDHLKGRSLDYLCSVSTVVFIVALLIFLPASPNRMSLASLTIAIIIPIAMTLISHFMTSRNMKLAIYPAAILGLGLLSLLVLRVTLPSVLHQMVQRIGIFYWPMGTTVLEMQPLLFPAGNFSFSVAWGNFTTSSFLGLIALGILVYFVAKRGETDKTLFIIWSLIMLAATLAMRRFAYYFVINIALLSGYLSWLILEFSGFKTTTAETVEVVDRTKKKAKPKRRDSSRSFARQASMALGAIVIFFLVFFPNISKAANTASQAPFAPSDAWYESLSWLKGNTPEPFSNPDFYYDLYEPSSLGKSYDYPETAYGVTAWWDYGYWITRIGHRIPTSTPGTGNRGEASFFTAQDEVSANTMLDQKGSDYVIVDYAIAAVIQGKFHALATLSGSVPGEFYDVYYQPKGNVLEPVILYYPEYYRSLVVRLYNFDGLRVIPKSSMVISYEAKVTSDGKPYKQITNVQSFDSYEEAQRYVANKGSNNFRIVSPNPYSSPVSLPALEHYSLVYSSKSSPIKSEIGIISQVKIFQYLK